MEWYKFSNPQDVPSPALLVYPERIKRNIQQMVKVAGKASRLRPHVKTHKCREIVSLQQEAGIEKFKCATIAEAEMLAECQVKDVLLAYQPTGPNISRLLTLMDKYPRSTFSALADNKFTVAAIAQKIGDSGIELSLFIDLDVGMHRTGIQPGAAARELREQITNSNCLKFRGWHVYDGHLRQSEFAQRKSAVAASFTAVEELLSDDPHQEVVAGGTPTFPVHALNPRVDLSPGTCLLWDRGYSQKLPDQEFLQAAILLTRVVSKPYEDLLCLDLGHKSIGSEMPHPRVFFPQLERVEFTGHSEEHLVIRTTEASNFEVGNELYGIPMHICPTVALHQELLVVEERQVVDRWKVYARDRRISV